MNQKSLIWSGRSDSNTRPPAPKADSVSFKSRLVFKYLEQKEFSA